MQLRFFLLAASASIRCSYDWPPSLHWPLEPPRCSRPQWCWETAHALAGPTPVQSAGHGHSPGVCPSTQLTRQAGQPLTQCYPIVTCATLVFSQTEHKSNEEKGKAANTPESFSPRCIYCFQFVIFPEIKGTGSEHGLRTHGARPPSHHWSGFPKISPKHQHGQLPIA